MDLVNLLLLLLFVAGGIVSLIFGIKFLIKYKATRKTPHLILGIVLTFVVPAIIFFIVFRGLIPNTRGLIPNTMIDYGPGPGMVYGPGPV